MSALLCFILPNFGNPIFVNNVGWLARFCPVCSYPIIIYILVFYQTSNEGNTFVIMILLMIMSMCFALCVTRILFVSHGELSGFNVSSSESMILNINMCVPICSVGQQ